jgi:hypothetical protein
MNNFFDHVRLPPRPPPPLPPLSPFLFSPSISLSLLFNLMFATDDGGTGKDKEKEEEEEEEAMSKKGGIFKRLSVQRQCLLLPPAA